MRLRARLALTTLVVTLPLSVCLLRVDRVARHEAARTKLRAYATARMTELRAECEASPQTFGGELAPPIPPPPPDAMSPGGPPRSFGGAPPPPKPPFPPGEPNDPRAPFYPPPARARRAVVFAYDLALQSKNPGAPAVSHALVEAIDRGADEVDGDSTFGDDVVLLARMPWRSGPCAFALARGTTDPAWGAILPESSAWLLPTLAVFLAMFVATGPFVARVRRLTRDVSRSRDENYASSVEERGDDEIAELARAFNVAGDEIRASLAERRNRERALREFVSNTTHDVMLPLTVLQGHLATLRERSARGEALDGTVVVSAMDEAHYMASLLHDLRVTARLESGEDAILKSPVDLRALVRRVVARHALIAREHGVAIASAVPDEPVNVVADETVIEQAASNIVYNAVKYNRDGGHVAVILDATDDTFSIEVKDDGIGMSDEELACVTGRGFRGDEARSRRPKGQGLGLHIAQRAVLLHGFSLRFEHGKKDEASHAEGEKCGVTVRIEGPRTRAS